MEYYAFSSLKSLFIFVCKTLLVEKSVDTTFISSMRKIVSGHSCVVLWVALEKKVAYQKFYVKPSPCTCFIHLWKIIEFRILYHMVYLDVILAKIIVYINIVKVINILTLKEKHWKKITSIDDIVSLAIKRQINCDLFH